MDDYPCKSSSFEFFFAKSIVVFDTRGSKPSPLIMEACVKVTNALGSTWPMKDRKAESRTGETETTESADETAETPAGSEHALPEGYQLPREEDHTEYLND